MLVVTWAAMVVSARRLPPGAAKDLASVLPACVTTARRLRRDPRVPRRVKLAVGFASLWVLSPVDLIPEVLRSSARWTMRSSWRSHFAMRRVRYRETCCSRHGQARHGFSPGCYPRPGLRLDKRTSIR